MTARATDVLAGKLDLEAIQTGADAIQIVYDGFSQDDIQNAPYLLGEAYATVRRATILPLIIEVKADSNTGNRLSQEIYAQYLNLCLRFAPDYLLVDFTIDDALLRGILGLRGNTKIVAQYSGIAGLEGSWESSTCLTWYKRAADLGADVVQMTQRAKSNVDYLPLQGFRHRTHVLFPDGPPLSAFDVGIHGRRSQCFNPTILPVLSDPSISPPNDDTTAHVSAQQATNALFSAFVLDAQNFCIVGGNVDFSLSPAMHNAAYTALGMPHSYTAHSTDSVETIQTLMLDDMFGGAAVTQPYKIEAIRLVQSLSRHARIIRALNTVLPIRGDLLSGQPIPTTRNLNGRILGLHGDNTDWIGIRACIRRGLSPINTIRSVSCGLVIGAGGMARAAIYAMLHLGVQNIFVCNRTVSHAEELAQYYNEHCTEIGVNEEHVGSQSQNQQRKVHVIPSLKDQWPEGYRQPTIVISSVPAQNINGVFEAPFTLPQDWLKSPTGGVVVELTYKPLITSLVRQVRAESHRGWIVMNGLDMLPEQAFAQFELFTGRRAPRRIMREEIRKAYRNGQGVQEARTRQNSHEPTSKISDGV